MHPLATTPRDAVDPSSMEIAINVANLACRRLHQCNSRRLRNHRTNAEMSSSVAVPNNAGNPRPCQWRRRSLLLHQRLNRIRINVENPNNVATVSSADNRLRHPRHPCRLHRQYHSRKRPRPHQQRSRRTNAENPNSVATVSNADKRLRHLHRHPCRSRRPHPLYRLRTSAEMPSNVAAWNVDNQRLRRWPQCRLHRHRSPRHLKLRSRRSNAEMLNNVGTANSADNLSRPRLRPKRHQERTRATRIPGRTPARRKTRKKMPMIRSAMKKIAKMNNVNKGTNVACDWHAVRGPPACCALLHSHSHWLLTTN